MLEKLARLLNALEAETSGMPPSAAHWIPDIVLLGYVAEILDNGRAVLHLAGAHPPLHAIPAARSSFEAAQNLLMLVTSTDYDEGGALAYVYGLRKDHEITLQYADALAGRAPEAGGPGWLESAVLEIGEMWESLAPGSQAVVKNASARLSARKHQKPDNWHGLNPATELASRFERNPALRAPGGYSPGTAFRNTYRALCRDTHPRTIVRPVGVTRSSTGTVHTDLESRSPTETRSVAVNAATGTPGSRSAFR